MSERTVPVGYVGRRVSISEKANVTLNELAELTGLDESQILSEAIENYAQQSAQDIAELIEREAKERAKNFLAKFAK